MRRRLEDLRGQGRVEERVEVSEERRAAGAREEGGFGQDAEGDEVGLGDARGTGGGDRGGAEGVPGWEVEVVDRVGLLLLGVVGEGGEGSGGGIEVEGARVD